MNCAAKLLLIEDDKDLRLIFAARLRRAGFDVVDADSLARAMEIINENNEFDLVITDVNLGDGNGFDFIRHATSDSMLMTRAGLQFIVVSGHATIPNDIKPKILAYFEKPFDTRGVCEAISQATRRTAS